MPDDIAGRERSDELVEKIGAMLKASNATNERTERIKIGIQVVQLVLVGVVGTAITFYADRIKSEQERHNQEIAASLKEDETKAAKAKGEPAAEAQAKAPKKEKTAEGEDKKQPKPQAGKKDKS